MSKQNGMLVRATGQKNANFKIQDGGQPPFWKSSNRHISVKNYPISMKFGTLQQIWTRLQSRDQKLNVLNFKTAATAVLKIVISRYLLYAVVHQILSKSNNSFTEIWWLSRFSRRRSPPSWILKRLLFGHVTAIGFNICCSILQQISSNFIEIG